MKFCNAPLLSTEEIQEKFAHFSHWEDDFFQKSFYTKGGDESLNGFLPQKNLSYRERTLREAEGIIHILKLKKGDSLLDVPCGAGRHIAELSQKGIDVHGIEQHPDQIVCASPAIQEKIRKGSMYSLPFLENSFDAVTNMFFSFGFSQDHAENQEFLNEAFRVLKNGGKFLLHTDVVIEEQKNGDWKFPDWYQFSETRDLQNGKNLHIREWGDEKNRRLIGEWEISGKIIPYSMEIYSDQEYIRMFEQAGFSEVEIFSDWEKNIFDFSRPQEMIVMGRKK